MAILWQAKGRIVAGNGRGHVIMEAYDGRYMKELEGILGWRPYPGSAQFVIEPRRFDFKLPYIEGEILHPDNPGRVSGTWHVRTLRLYPVKINEHIGAVRYRADRLQASPGKLYIFSPVRLRDYITESDKALITVDDGN